MVGGIGMNENKELQHRCHCPYCSKVFDNRYEGFVVNGYLICADCYNKLQYKTVGQGFVKF